MSPRVVATVDLGAIRHNLHQIRARAPRAKVMAAVKADAYGHGAVPVARTLVEAGVDALAVACMEEALVLRRAHIGGQIALLEGILSPEEAAMAVYEQLDVVLHDHWQIDLLHALGPTAQVRVWFKLDTGMHRLGFPVEDVPRLQRALTEHPRWQFAGWITHLACADDPDDPFTPQQLARFSEALQGVPGPRSIANSAGLLGWPQTHVDWVRPGLALYGASPITTLPAERLGLKPAMAVASRLIAVRCFNAGETLGYGRHYTCPERMPVGVVAIGYADGLPRAVSSRAEVAIDGQRLPLAGRVSMDMITIDLRSMPNARVGSTVQIWGPGLPAEHLAEAANTIVYELFCGLTQRVQFQHRNG
ncbi:alanine racemase [Polycyclovorans algicola]|uniref:alanine racemase n=1 Tax=Polycyclovorans algicola TaxID=616992 RepID=UPI0004A6C97E|nr:alanine racemase [Polycyclovorans algicola]